MRSIIEELYYGNISPSDRDIIRGGTYSHILNLVTRNEDELMQTLTQAQQETFEKFKDCASELGDKNEMMSFVLGFKLGMRLAVEAMISLDDITYPKSDNHSRHIYIAGKDTQAVRNHADQKPDQYHHPGRPLFPHLIFNQFTHHPFLLT